MIAIKPEVIRQNKQRIGAGAVLIFKIAYGAYIPDIGLDAWSSGEVVNARTFPKALAWIAASLSSILLLQSGDRSLLSIGGRPFFKVGLLKVLCLLGLMASYTWWVGSLGFVLATTLLLLVGFWVMGERRPVVLFLGSLPFALGFWLLATKVLSLYLQDDLAATLLGGGR